MAEVWQLLASLAAIVALVLVVRALRLGSSPAFANEDDVRRAASLAADDFTAADIAIDRNGAAALLVDHAGRVLILRAHGAHVAGRMLGPLARAHLDDGALVVDPADRRFGTMRFAIAEPERWRIRIERL